MVNAMRALDRKLWRDLRQLRGQAVAIGLVMASGVACFIMFLSTLDSLLLSRELYYRDYRFAEIFAPLKRAPEPVRLRIAEIEGVDKVDSRVVAPVTIDIEGFDEPVVGMVTSLPDSGEPLMDWVKFREELYSGPQTKYAPDIVFCARNYSFLARQHFGDPRIIRLSEHTPNGFHRPEGIFIARGSSLSRCRRFCWP